MADETVQLERFEVSEVPLEQQILPTARPFTSVFGTSDNIVDVPRNVTIISRQQLSDISIESVLDFSKLTSSAFTTTNFGAPANASIRGQSADVFLNGVRSRITSNGNGLPLDFNSVESVNIVKGPATAVQGTSMYVGGFIDLVSKRPYFDGFKGSASYTIGSYSTHRWTIDVGGPASSALAYRFSYSGEDSEGYFENGFKKTHSFYGALTWRPTKSYELFLNGQYFYANYTENWGVNRVTQNLIDHGLYTTGINVNNDSAGSPSDPQNSQNVLGTGNEIAWGPEVKLNRHKRLLRPGNDSFGQEYNLQAIQTFRATPDLTVKNTSFWSYTKRDTLSTYYYTEIIDPSTFMENRTEVIIEKETFSLNTGLDLRYQRTKAYDDYFYEPANVWDLTKDPAYIDVYNSPDFTANHGFPVPGWPNRFAQPGIFNGDTNDSRGVTVGPFAQSTFDFTPKFSVVAGARADYFKAKVREPLFPGNPEDEIDVWLPNLNGSLIYKPTEKSSVYLTYNYSKNTSGAVGNGGGITGWAGEPDANGNWYLDKESFQQPSRLLELGTKYALYDNRMFLNFAIYDQKRTAKSTSSTVIQEFEYKGFEAEMNFQPNKRIYAAVSYSYIDAESSAGFQYGLFDGASEMPPGNSNGTVPIGTVTRVSGLPEHLFNALVSYSMENGLTFTANAVVTGKMNNNTAGTVVIPTQYTIDAAVSYTIGKWMLRAQVLNVTNEENWSPPNAVYGNGSILALPGTQVQFTARYSF
jgi:Outer membrane receptor for monomeric catechols